MYIIVAASTLTHRCGEPLPTSCLLVQSRRGQNNVMLQRHMQTPPATWASSRLTWEQILNQFLLRSWIWVSIILHIHLDVVATPIAYPQSNWRCLSAWNSRILPSKYSVIPTQIMFHPDTIHELPTIYDSTINALTPTLSNIDPNLNHCSLTLKSIPSCK